MKGTKNISSAQIVPPGSRKELCYNSAKRAFLRHVLGDC
jgi:hypothetical protein